MGCFVRGVKKWHGMFCPGMFCPTFMHFRVFSEGQGTEWRIFLGCLNFKYLFGVLEMHVCLFLWGGGGGEQ